MRCKLPETRVHVPCEPGRRIGRNVKVDWPAMPGKESELRGEELHPSPPLSLSLRVLRFKPCTGRLLASHLYFKMTKNDCKLVENLLRKHGFTRVYSRESYFNLLWSSGQLRTRDFRSLAQWQRANHFPGSRVLTRKDHLYDCLRLGRLHAGVAFDFIPEYFVLPRDEKILKAKLVDEESQPVLIVKPVGSSRGRGIFLTANVLEVLEQPAELPQLVSSYISNPLLIDGHKFDVRLYVAVTSFSPLIAYIYSEGIVRLASEQYSLDAENVHFVHLTNYSLNKKNSSFIRNETLDREDLGHKWTLGALLRRLDLQGHDTKMLMLRVEDVVVKTLLAAAPSIAAASRRIPLSHPSSCFELFGFDILIDDHLKPWLLEVNLSPSLSCDAPLDEVLKTRMVCDLLSLICLPVPGPPIKISTTVSNNKTRPVPLKGPTVSMASLTAKIRAEESCKNGFIRLFPRPSFPLYKFLLSKDSLDLSLCEWLFPFVNGSYEEDFCTLHSELMETSQFPSFPNLSASTQKHLAESYHAADFYLQIKLRRTEIMSLGESRDISKKPNNSSGKRSRRSGRGRGVARLRSST